MEERVEHLQILGVLTSDFEVGILEVVSHRSFPLQVLEVLRDIIEDLLLLQSALGVLIGTLLDFQSVELLVLKLQCKPNC